MACVTLATMVNTTAVETGPSTGVAITSNVSPLSLADTAAGPGATVVVVVSLVPGSVDVVVVTGTELVVVVVGDDGEVEVVDEVDDVEVEVPPLACDGPRADGWDGPPPQAANVTAASTNGAARRTSRNSCVKTPPGWTSVLCRLR